MTDPIEKIRLPFDFSPSDIFDGMYPRTLVELRMMAMSREIRSKRDWKEKIRKSEIVDRWLAEASEQGLTRNDVEYVIEELKYYASLDGPHEVGPVEGTWQAFHLLAADQVAQFQETIYNLLENVPEDQKDFHPGSNDQVLDLVHPSLFCYVSGVSHNTQPIEDSPAKKLKLDDGKIKYQWLPSEFGVDAEGKVTINTYINNLHPEKHKTLYPLIAKIFELFVPLFENVLTDLLYPQIRINSCSYLWFDGIECPVNSDDSDYGNKMVEWEKSREVKQPSAPKFIAPDQNREKISLKGRSLQVIVKLANIELTPEKPDYPGGVWHVEGTAREAIVATGIYYYSMSNVTESRLMFRQVISDPPYEQEDNMGVEAVFGIRDMGPMNQELGAAISQEGLFLAFPNVYQHRVAPFSLVDRTRKGHRKILVLFLVDPRRRIISTKHVAMQQKNWNDDDADESPETFTMTLEDAKKFREDLMFERKYYRDELNNELFERPFSLCEH